MKIQKARWITLLIVLNVVALNAQLWNEVTFENASISNYDLTDNGVSYKHAIEGTDVDSPGIVNSTTARKGTKSIIYSVGSSSSTKQRTEHAFVHYSNPEPIPIGGERYAGFSFRLDSAAFTQSNTWFNLFQVQMNDGGFPALQFVIGKTLGIQIAHGERDMRQWRILIQEVYQSPSLKKMFGSML